MSSLTKKNANKKLVGALSNTGPNAKQFSLGIVIYEDDAVAQNSESSILDDAGNLIQNQSGASSGLQTSNADQPDSFFIKQFSDLSIKPVWTFENLSKSFFDPTSFNFIGAFNPSLSASLDLDVKIAATQEITATDSVNASLTAKPLAAPAIVRDPTAVIQAPTATPLTTGTNASEITIIHSLTKSTSYYARPDLPLPEPVIVTQNPETGLILKRDTPSYMVAPRSHIYTTSRMTKGINGDGTTTFEKIETAVENTYDCTTTRTTTFDYNGDGVVDLKQVIVSVFDASGNTTIVSTNYDGSGTKLSETTTQFGPDDQVPCLLIGNETLANPGTDIFVYSAGFGNETITEFAAGDGATHDTLQLSLGAQFTSLAQVIAASTQVGANTVITIDAADTITLNNVNKSSLVASNFVFA